MKKLPKLIITDIDGVWTDGGMYYDQMATLIFNCLQNATPQLSEVLNFFHSLPIWS